MTTAVWGYLDRGLRGLCPFVLTIGLVLVSVLPILAPGTGPITPALTLMAVYFWSVHRPDLLPIAATFVVGVVQEDGLAEVELARDALLGLLREAVPGCRRHAHHGQRVAGEARLGEDVERREGELLRRCHDNKGSRALLLAGLRLLPFGDECRGAEECRCRKCRRTGAGFIHGA